MLNLLYAISAGLWAVIPLTCVIGWSIAISRVVSGRPIVDFVPRRRVPWGVVDLFLMLLVSIGMQVFATFMLSAVRGEVVDTQLLDSDPQLRAFWMGIHSLSTLVTCLLAIALVRQRVLADNVNLGIDDADIRRDVMLGVVAFAMLIVPVFAIQYALTRIIDSHHPLIDLLREHPDPWFFVVGGVAAVAIAPVVEEYLFRVFLQGWLENLASLSKGVRRGATYPHGFTRGVVLGMPIDTDLRQADPIGASEVVKSAYDVEIVEADPSLPPQRAFDADFETERNPYASPADAATEIPTIDDSGEIEMRPAIWPIVVSSALFALAHFQHGPDPVPLFVLALGLGYLYQRTHRVLPCIVVHCLVNAISLFQLWLWVNAPTP